VSLRYAFADGAGALVSGGVAPLDVDVPAGHTLRAISLVAPPARVGRFRLCLDLVQRVAGELLPLPVAHVEREVEVLGIVPPQQGEHGRLARYAAWLAGEPEVARYPCATPR
jgi:hypothetical protein